MDLVGLWYSWSAWKAKFLLLQAADSFNTSVGPPAEIIKDLRRDGIITSRDPHDIALFLWPLNHAYNVDRHKIGMYLTSGNTHSRAVLELLWSILPLRGLSFVDALKFLLLFVFPPKEEEKAFQILLGFSHNYLDMNPSHSLIDPRASSELAYSVLALNNLAAFDTGADSLPSKAEFIHFNRHLTTGPLAETFLADTYDASVMEPLLSEVKPKLFHEESPPLSSPPLRRARSWPNHFRGSPMARVNRDLSLHDIVPWSTTISIFYTNYPRCLLAHVDDRFVLKIMSASVDVDSIVDYMRRAATVFPNQVPAVHEFGRKMGCSYILMDRIGGHQLMSLMHRRPNRNYDKVYGQIATIVSGLATINISHNDLNPQNVMVTKDLDVLAIIDWDFAGSADRSMEYQNRTLNPWHHNHVWDWDFAFRRAQANSVLMHGYGFSYHDVDFPPMRFLEEEALCSTY
ncbi:hypothetical protein PLICRDRAFT_36975 [Plicaturopsis crispa FD-325 SS-3]|nr:hypothetical protein PLICRDRAFT_36975 [Plicaturopsis crispa FD-325 SS-3]